MTVFAAAEQIVARQNSRGRLIHVGSSGRQPDEVNTSILPHAGQERLNPVVYSVGLVVIVLVILGFFGLR